MIKANDALTVRFLRRRSSRHEDAAGLLKEMLRLHRIPERYAGGRRALLEALQEKSEFDYGGAHVGIEEAERRIRRAEKFLEAAREILAS
jgi:uncharacterized protein (UPF0332 family)